MNRLLLIAIFVALPAQSLQSGTPEPFARPQSQPTPSPPCTINPTGESASTPVYTYVEEPIQELKKQVPALRTIRLEPAQDPIASMLDKTGDVLADLYHHIPNLVAREEVRRPLPPAAPSSIPLARRGGNLDATQDDSTVTRYHSQVYVYRIVPGRGPAGMEILSEFRTDSHDRPIDDSRNDPDSPRNVGFATSWLFFFRANRQESRFRYLGHQKTGKRDTFVIAFAQNPGHDRLNTVVDSSNGQCSVPSQGVAWIDQSTYHIVRMQTDLLFPVPSIRLTQLRSVLDYSEVRIPERDLLLWLPDIVKNSWQTAGVSGEELYLYTYTHYRLFGSTVRVVPDAEMPPSSPSNSPPNPRTP